MTSEGQARPHVLFAATLALALLSFFQFPGHTWLQQDSQIYVPILEHLRDPSALRNDILAQKPHVAFTLYDEAARLLRAVSGLGFKEVLQAQQIAARAFGIFGLYLMAGCPDRGIRAYAARHRPAAADLCDRIGGSRKASGGRSPGGGCIPVPSADCAALLGSLPGACV